MRTVEFVPSGARVYASGADIVTAWRKYSSKIPAQYALGTAQHETDFTINEVDAEASGFVSKGIYQLSDEELASTGTCCDLLTLEGSTQVLAIVAERRLVEILKAADLNPNSPAPPDARAFLAVAHNQGLSAALKSIRSHGINWSAYINRNPSLAGSIGNYGSDCITGGVKWSPVFDV